VGSDKLSEYGRKGEHDLIVKTLGDARANAHILYFERHCKAIDVERDISPYDWMLARWKTGFFEKSQLPSFQISASAVRAALAESDGKTEKAVVANALPPAVLKFIRGNNDMLSSYSREAALKRSKE